MSDSMKLVYENDAPIDALKGKTVAVLGYGSQGHAHSLNLRDSGIKVIVTDRKDTNNWRLAVQHGFEPMAIEDAVKAAIAIGPKVVVPIHQNRADPARFSSNTSPVRGSAATMSDSLRSLFLEMRLK